MRFNDVKLPILAFVVFTGLIVVGLLSGTNVTTSGESLWGLLVGPAQSHAVLDNAALGVF